MPLPEDPVALKRLLSPLLLEIKGVSGLGLPAGRLTVYLESDDDELRLRVQRATQEAAPGATLAFEVTGRFRSQ